MAQKDDMTQDLPDGGSAPAGALSALLARAAELGGGAAPVHLWNPADCGPIPMRIDRDGVWHYNGSPIRRDKMVRLFASVLRREADGRYVLVTPYEKVTLEVEDVPFQAVEMVREEEGDPAQQVLVLRTGVGDVVRAGPDHPIRFAVDPQTEGLIPYVRVRGALDARFSRAVAAELAEDLVEEGERWGVWSGGVFFPVGAE